MIWGEARAKAGKKKSTATRPGKKTELNNPEEKKTQLNNLEEKRLVAEEKKLIANLDGLKIDLWHEEGKQG